MKKNAKKCLEGTVIWCYMNKIEYTELNLITFIDVVPFYDNTHLKVLNSKYLQY